MIRRLVVIVALLLILAGCLALPWPLIILSQLVSSQASRGSVEEAWNQRMTLTIQTPSGVVSGSSVQRIVWKGLDAAHRTKTPTNSTWSRFYPQGEAVAVEIAPGRWLFALLKGAQGWQGEPGTNFGYAVAVPLGHHASSVEAVAVIKSLPKDQPLPLPPEAWPLIVTFDDISDPKTVRRVDPSDLAASFGPGVQLKAVTLEVTNEAVTEGRITNALSCVKAGKGCTWHDLNVPYGDPLFNLNGAFVRNY